MIDEKFVLLASALIIFGDVSYLIDAIKGKIQPNRVTWFLWALAALMAFVAEIQQQVGITALMTGAVGIIPLLIFIASFINNKAYWKITNIDLLCGVLSVIGLILWKITAIGNMAILFGIFADGVAAVPTIIKSYKAPETENYHAFLFSILGSAITLLTIKKWDFAHYGFPLYIFLICFILFLLIKFRLGKKINV